MNNSPIKQRIASSIFSKIPSYILEKLTGTSLIIPYYHMVSDDEIPHVNQLYGYKNERQFRDDLDFLMRNYSPISLQDVIAFLKRGSSLPEKAFLLTFDDGFREGHDVIAPILKEKGIPATFFINSAFIDNKRLCYQHKSSILAGYFQKGAPPVAEGKIREKFRERGLECDDVKQGILDIAYQRRDLLDEIARVQNVDFDDYLVRHKPYLDSVQVKKLIKDGFTIGAHSIDHPIYSSLSLEDQLYQTIESVRRIKEKFSLDYGAFAFPNSDQNVSSKFFEILFGRGVVEVSFGNSGMIRDSFSNNLQRFSLEKPLMPAERIISLNFARNFRRSFTEGGNVIRRG